MGIYENMQPLTWAITVPFVVITSFSCLLRFYSRIYIAKQFGADDWWMVAGSIVWLGQQVILGQMIAYGGGKVVVAADDLAKITLLLFIEEFVYILAQFLIKISFLQFYLRVLNGSQRYRMVCHGITAFVVLQTTGVWILYGLQCLPIDAFFHPLAHPDAKCISTEFSLYFPASLNVFVDLIIYVLPIYPVWNLQMSVRRRIGLLSCFTVGGSTIIVSLLRFIVLKQLAAGSRTSYVYGSVCIITTIEFCTAILTANMPALRPVWRKHISGTLSTGDGGGYDHSSHHELGNVSAIRSRKAGRGSVALRSQSPSPGQHWPTGSEEELFKGNKIVVNTQVDITTKQQSTAEEGPEHYYNFPATQATRSS